jgi:hypothetical protein
VSELATCPYCGSPVGSGTDPDSARNPARGGEGGLEPLYREVRRIREIAETRAAGDDARRIAELTRQVGELRATVARLRGPGESRLAGAGQGASGRRSG